MFGPGEYVPDPTEGIVDIKDLPRPQLVAYGRNHEHTPCPRFDHLAYRHKCGQRTLHDLGDLSTGCPVDLLVVYSSHYCSPCRKHFNIALNDVASLGGHYTHRVIQMAVRPVVEDGLPYLEQALTLLDDTLLPATSNAVERGNRRHRKRQKSVYRVRSKVCLEGRI